MFARLANAMAVCIAAKSCGPLTYFVVHNVTVVGCSRDVVQFFSFGCGQLFVNCGGPRQQTRGYSSVVSAVARRFVWCRVVLAQAVGRTLMGESSAAECRSTDGVRLWVCRMVGRHTYVVCWGPSLRSGLVYRVWCFVGSGGVT